MDNNKNYKEVDIRSFIHDNIITKEKYKELRNKYANGEELTIEELKYLKDATVYFNRKEQVLKLKNGYVDKPFMLYIGFAIISVIALIILVITRVD